VNDSIFHNKSVIWNEYITHSTNDAYWQARNIRPHLKNIKPATLLVGGMFDAEDMFGALSTYKAIEKQNAKNNNYLLMGPWTHGGWAWTNFRSYATYNFQMNTSKMFEETEAAFFNYFLKGKGEWKQSEATIFFTGINQWKTFNEWPVKNLPIQHFYFGALKKLTSNRPFEKTGKTSYISDPANPVPYSPLKIGRRDNQYLGADQRFLKDRKDVVSFEGEPLNADLTIAGPVTANLYVSTTGTDADFVVKIIDVHPDSMQQLVRAEVIRGKFRNSYSKPEPFKPGKITKVQLVLNDVAHCFLAGHRLMVQVQSSWFPLVDRNPQTFMNIPDADEKSFHKATISIEHNSHYPSSIECSLLIP
jgi:putative CocE/NonD family hydrolase